jgi:hypothetical protein
MPTGMSLPSFGSATSRGYCGASQANKRLLLPPKSWTWPYAFVCSWAAQQNRGMSRSFVIRQPDEELPQARFPAVDAGQKKFNSRPVVPT